MWLNALTGLGFNKKSERGLSESAEIRATFEEKKQLKDLINEKIGRYQ